MRSLHALAETEKAAAKAQLERAAGCLKAADELRELRYSLLLKGLRLSLDRCMGQTWRRPQAKRSWTGLSFASRLQTSSGTDSGCVSWSELQRI